VLTSRDAEVDFAARRAFQAFNHLLHRPLFGGVAIHVRYHVADVHALVLRCGPAGDNARHHDCAIAGVSGKSYANAR
jgi:hypothetical protein